MTDAEMGGWSQPLNARTERTEHRSQWHGLGPVGLARSWLIAVDAA
jgi:hypothetical protein